MRLLQVLPETVADCWPHILPFLELIADGRRDFEGRRAPLDIAAAIIDGRSLCWAIVDDAGSPVAVVMGEIVVFPKMKVLRLVSCAGDGRQKWIHLLSEIEDFARLHGCVKAEIVSRKGWARLLPEYHLTHVVLEKTL